MKINKKILTFLNNNWIILGLLALLSIIVFFPSIKGPFIYDDTNLIVKNEHIHSLSKIKEYFISSTRAGALKSDNLYRPLSTVTYAVIYNFFGAKATFFHLFNIILHSVNGFLLFHLLKQLKFKHIVALFAVIIFLVHPIQTESVSYISGLPDIMILTWILLSTLLFLKLPEKNATTWHVLGLYMCTICGFLTKEVGVIIPPILLLLLIYIWPKIKGINRKKLLAHIGGISILAGIFLICKFTILNFEDSIGLSIGDDLYEGSIIVRIYTFLWAVPEYFKLIFFPKDLFFIKEGPVVTTYGSIHTILGSIIILAGAVLSILSLKKKRIFALGALWFAIAIFPVTGILIPLNAVYFEHWLYTPIIGIALLVSYFLCKINNKRKIGYIVLIIIILIFSGRTFTRSAEWADPIAFYKNELSYNDTAVLHSQIGLAYMVKREWAGNAIEHFEKAIEIDASLVYPYTNLGVLYLHLGEEQKAAKSLFISLQLNPSNASTIKALQKLSMNVGKNDVAEQLGGLIERIRQREEVVFEDITAITHPNIENTK
jgi:protein O-mannosyl-transferase